MKRALHQKPCPPVYLPGNWMLSLSDTILSANDKGVLATLYLCHLPMANRRFSGDVAQKIDLQMLLC